MVTSYPVVYTPEPKKPSGGPMPGTVALLRFAVGEFDVAVDGDEITSWGIYNPRDVCGNEWDTSKPQNGWACTGSQHARGAAGDAKVPVVPGGHREGWRLALWLVEHHVALGVQEVIFAERRWTNQTQEWRKYSGRSRHYDHVHFAQNDAGARGLTDDQIRAVWDRHPAPEPSKPVLYQEEDPMFIITPADGIVLLHAGKLTYIGKPGSLDPEINQWDLRNDPDTCARIVKQYGPIVR